MIAMAYFMLSLGLLTILTLHVASRLISFNCSDLQSSASDSHNTDLLQVTTLQYCIVDNCTIMRIDTGQQLGIVYTTEDLLIVTPVDGHTSMVIAKIDEDLPCPKIHWWWWNICAISSCRISFTYNDYMSLYFDFSSSHQKAPYFV